MNEISVEDRVNLVLRAAAGETHTLLAIEYNNAHPGQIIHNYDINNLMMRFKSTGMVLSSKEAKSMCRKCKSRSFDQNDVDMVLHTMNDNPHTSINRTSLITGVPASTTQRIMKDSGLFPYKMTIMQELTPLDFVSRLEMCQFFRTRFQTDPNFQRKIIFTDEALFHVNGTVNRHNFRYF